MKKELILASASQRRKDILTMCKVRFRPLPSKAKELLSQKEKIENLVVLNARKKAEYAARGNKNSVILGADTLVEIKKVIIGKPGTGKRALKLFKSLLKQKIKVCTGLYVVDTKTGLKASGHKNSYIFVGKIDKNEILTYFNALKPHSRAGGFSMEGFGSLIFDNIKGSYFNILGLPMNTFALLLKKINHNILDFCEIKK